MKLARYKIALALIDYLLLNLSFALALRIRFYPEIDIIDLARGYVITEILVFALISLFLLYFFENNQLYKYQTFTNRKLHFVKIFRTLWVDIFISLVVLSFIFKLGGRFESRFVVISFVLISGFLFFIYRILLFKNIFLSLQRKGYFQRKLVIYGAGKKGKKVLSQVSQGFRWSFLGFIDDDKERSIEEQIIGNFDILTKLRKHDLVNTVIIAIDNISHERLQALIDQLILLDLQIFVISDSYEVLVRTQDIEIIDKLPLIEVNYNSKAINILIVKRIMDFSLTVLALLVLSPLLFFIAIAIKTTSKGPVIYVQKRIGKDGKAFNFYKFRSMFLNNKPDAHQKFVTEFIEGKVKTDGPLKIQNDPRVTSIGRFIRKTSFDELPQLFNVIKGEMSLVGPRPCLPYEYEKYKQWHKSRFMVKPGCTGVWQVSGRSEVSFDEMVVMDYYYIHNMSPWLDVKLIIKTIPVMLFGKGGF